MRINNLKKLTSFCIFFFKIVVLLKERNYSENDLHTILFLQRFHTKKLLFTNVCQKMQKTKKFKRNILHILITRQQNPNAVGFCLLSNV